MISPEIDLYCSLAVVMKENSIQSCYRGSFAAGSFIQILVNHI